MAKPFCKLRALIIEKDKLHYEIAEVIDVDSSAFSKRITGRTFFTMTEIYTICDYLGIPEEQIHIYFPKSDVLGIINNNTSKGCK